MGNVRIELNEKAVGDLLKGPEMQAYLLSLAEQKAELCGEGYEASVFVAETRAVGKVRAKTKAAKKDNMENNTLLKALN